MNRLSQLATTALIGTARAHESSPTSSATAAGSDINVRKADAIAPLRRSNSAAQTLDELDLLLARTDTTNPAADLLNAAGAISVYTAVGTPPRRQRNRPAQMPDDLSNHPLFVALHAAAPKNEAPTVRLPMLEEARSLLATILEGRHAERLTEFLTVLALTDFRVPAEYLPQLFEAGQRQVTVRQALAKLLDHQARGIARYSADWSYITLEPAQWESVYAQWQQADSAARQVLVRQVRATEPPVARQLIESQWKTVDLPTRTWMLRILRDELSLADEPFLEQALDDRVHTIRRTAAELLAQLPSSRLCQRMAAAMANILTWTPEAETEITVHVPAEISPQMVRDGVHIRKGKDAARNHSAHLTDMIGAVPLTHWETTWGVTPAAIMAAARSSRWPNTLYNAFAIATQRQNNGNWAKALIAERGITTVTSRVIPALDESTLVTILTDVVQALPASQHLNKEHPLLIAVRRWPHRWPPALVELWLLALASTVEQLEEDEKTDSLLALVIKQCARSCEAESYPLLLQQLELLAAKPTTQQAALVESWTIVDFRQQMAQALAIPDAAFE